MKVSFKRKRILCLYPETYNAAEGWERKTERGGLQRERGGERRKEGEAEGEERDGEVVRRGGKGRRDNCLRIRKSSLPGFMPHTLWNIK